MDIRFTGKHMRVTDGMKEHIEGKLPRLEKYAPRIVESHVVLKKEKYFFEAEVTLLAKNFRAYGEGRAKENIFTAIDMAYVRVEKQLKKFREKIKEHHKEHGPRALPPKERVARQILDEEGPKPGQLAIVRDKDFAPEPMSAEEASLRLKNNSESFLVFLNTATQQVNVIFKREDGNHGLIEPEF